MANSDGVAHNQNKDRTGAPGSDNTCQQCHSGGAFTPQVNAFLVAQGDIALAAQYLPGEVHTIVVEVSSSGNPAGYGVHGTVVFGDGSNAGELIDQDANDCIWLDEVDGRHIFEQNDLCASGLFEVEWVAPEEGSGPVSVYVSSIAANGSGTSSGDVFVGGQFDFEEGVSSVEEEAVAAFGAFSRGQGQLEVSCDHAARCAIFSLDGRVLFDGDIDAGRHLLDLDHTGWTVIRCMTSSGSVWMERIWMNA